MPTTFKYSIQLGVYRNMQYIFPFDGDQSSSLMAHIIPGVVRPWHPVFRFVSDFECLRWRIRCYLGQRRKILTACSVQGKFVIVSRLERTRQSDGKNLCKYGGRVGFVRRTFRNDYQPSSSTQQLVIFREAFKPTPRPFQSRIFALFQRILMNRSHNSQIS